MTPPVGFYEIPYGMANLEAHPNNVPLIKHNASFDEIMAFGDTWRGRGRKPMVAIPSPTLGGALGVAWEEHTDLSGLIDNVPAHIDALIVDYANAVKPQTPPSWSNNKDYPEWLVWEYAPRKAVFNGSHVNHFIEKFGYDPRAWTPPVTPPPSGGGGTTEPPVVVAAVPRLWRVNLKIFGITISGDISAVVEE